MTLPSNRPSGPNTREDQRQTTLGRFLGVFFDPAWYLEHYPDVVAANLDPLMHFINHGAAERRNPNPYFDGEWYADHYPDVAVSGLHPLQHYLQIGAMELRHPHPRFDAVFYVGQHPDAAANPLLYHIRLGAARGYPTEKPTEIRDYLPSVLPPSSIPRGLTIDIVIPVYRGFDETRRCIASVLADPAQKLGRVIVIDDRSPEPKLVAWLQGLAASELIVLITNPRNVGFVESVNTGMRVAADHDVVLLNSDAEVPSGWLGRLAAQAYAEPRIATVSPFSNNATICGYPDNQGGPIVFDQSLGQIDSVCRSVNTARWVDVPTTVGFCMYIRRQALKEVGDFDVDRFTVGYGEENDFCLRASALGWHHRLACDTFVYHQGSVSFAGRAEELAARAMELILERTPDYARRVARHVTVGAVTPYRFAVTAGLFRASNLPVVLMISHKLGGGVRHHINHLTERYRDNIHTVLLEATDAGDTLSVPALPDHPTLTLPSDRADDLVTLLRSMDVSRVHIHHLAGLRMDIRRLVHLLGLPFDVTVHDYHAICPRINFLPWPDSPYCGEPDHAGCNACIGNRPPPDVHDILTWRAERAWQYLEADRVLCPSNDALLRLRRYGLDANAVFAPHEPIAEGPWPQHVTRPGSGRLRIAVLGVLADHKGARSVAAVAEAADPKYTEIHLIGRTELGFPKSAAKRLKMTGQYDDSDLQKLIARIAPHIIWFPTMSPETYSYTLSAAIETGIPIVTTEIGAFPERLAGRPFTWVARGYVSPDEWIQFFDTFRTMLNNCVDPPAPPSRPAVADFYQSAYLRPMEAAQSAVPARTPVRVHDKARRRTIAVVPERYDFGLPTPCAFIRLLQPLDHPAIAGDFRIVMADAKSVMNYDVDVIVTQRYALPTIAAADALIAHANRTGATLVYDLDDDLLNIPPNHPDAATLRPRARIVRHMLMQSDEVWLSSERLADVLSPIRSNTTVIGNSLDERIWTSRSVDPPLRDEPVRILCMGTRTHNRDFALIESVLARLKEDYGDRIEIDIIGMTTRDDLPSGLNRSGPPPRTGQSYPGFVSWLTSVQPRWHIGVAPLLDTPFNRAKSAIKTMDYAALGLAILASDVPAYHGSLADGPAGRLVRNDPSAWYAALDAMIRAQALRRSFAMAARPAFLKHASLLSQADAWRTVWTRLLDRVSPRGTPVRAMQG